VFRRRPRTEPEVPFDPTKVDLVALTPNKSTVQLYIVQDAPWTGSDEQLPSLQDKVHTHVSYAVDGQLARDHPRVTALPWQIVLDCQAGGPDARTTAALAELAALVTRHGGNLRTTVRNA
jgi:hypothetical protein